MLARGNVNRVYRIIRFNCDKRAFVQHTKKVFETKCYVPVMRAGNARPYKGTEMQHIYIIYTI